MRYYELIYIVNSNVERKKIDQVMKDISSRLQNTESKIINHVIWGKKKLAYPIKGNTYGNYIILHYICFCYSQYYSSFLMLDNFRDLPWNLHTRVFVLISVFHLSENCYKLTNNH